MKLFCAVERSKQLHDPAQFFRLHEKKNSGLQQDSNPWPVRNTGEMLFQLSYEATHWEPGHLYGFYCILFMKEIGKDRTHKNDLAPNVWLHSSVGRASFISLVFHTGQGFESC